MIEYKVWNIVEADRGTPERCESLSHSLNTTLNFSSNWCSRWSFAPSGGCEHIQAEPPSVWLLVSQPPKVPRCYTASMASTPLWPQLLLHSVMCNGLGSPCVVLILSLGPEAGGADGSCFVLQPLIKKTELTEITEKLLQLMTIIFPIRSFLIFHF